MTAQRGDQTGHGTHVLEGMTPRQAEIAQRLELPVMVAVLTAFPALVLHTLHLDGIWGLLVNLLNLAVWLVFLAEMVIMLRIAPDRRSWMRSNKLDIALVVLTPPFLPGPFQTLWLLRLLRLLDILPLFGRVFRIDGFRYVAILAFLAVFGGGLAFAELERDQEGVNNAWDGVWWAVVTITTTGYGDLFPVTTPGRALGMVVMSIGPIVVGMIAASVTQLLQLRIEEQVETTREIQSELLRVEGGVGQLSEDVVEIETDVERLTVRDQALLAQLDALGRQQERILEQLAKLEGRTG